MKNMAVAVLSAIRLVWEAEPGFTRIGSHPANQHDRSAEYRE